MGFGGSSLTKYLTNKQVGSYGRMITPDFPHIHPSVAVMAARPGDYEKKSGADYLFKPPEIMPPQAPYFYAPHRPDEYAFSLPPEHEYREGGPAPVAYPEPPPTCIPLKELPQLQGMLAALPPGEADSYCVPLKYLPFYHPPSWRPADQGPQPPPAGGGGNPASASGGASPSSPYFVVPTTPSPHFQVPLPFSHAPRFPGFADLGQGGPPPGPPPPPPANYPVAYLVNKPPPLPPPPGPPPMA
jgi:hypothetical protein